MSSSSMYHNTKAQAVKRPAARYAYEDDPTFQAFRSAVSVVCDRMKQRRIANWKLYPLWYVSNTFHGHWNELPSKKTSNDMVFILGHNFLTDLQSRMVMQAWLRVHFPKFSDANSADWEQRFFWPTWKRIQLSIQAARNRKNAGRREKRRTKSMKTRDGKKKSTLKYRILEALKQHPMTTALLAEKLDAHPKAVDGHLNRMSKAERPEVVELGRGLYALPGVIGTTPAPTPQPVRPEPLRVEPISLAGITDGVVDEWKSPPVLESRNSYRVAAEDEDGVCEPPDLKTAEPRWNRY